ncbi:MAG TPA: hypothetical protein VGM76_07150, partial [Lacipirellulaceae bacterium]|jgi:hypothetical protein
MNAKLFFTNLFISLVVGNVWGADEPAPTVGGLPSEAIANIAAGMIADAIPRDYEKYKDWGSTKRITTGLDFHGHVWDPKIDRRKSEVNDGVWKHYRVTLVEPEKNLVVRIENLRSVAAGQVAFTLDISAKVHGWAQARVYKDGIPLGSYTAEGDSVIDLSIDGEIGLETTPSSLISGIQIKPHVSAARVKLDDFNLTRIGEIKGALAHDLGDGLKHVVEDELDGPKLVERINHTLDKQKNKLKITPEKLLGLKTQDRRL